MGVAAVAAATLVLANRPQPFLEVKANYIASDRPVLDREDRILDEVRLIQTVRRLPWTPLQSVSPAFKEAIRLAEDRRFFWHFGVDPLAMAQATKGILLERRVRGASTITMQVVKLLDTRKGGRQKRGWLAKWNQMVRALALEAYWTKSDILEAYVNLLPFKGEVQGISAAAYGFFDRAPSALTLTQAAVLASLVRSPNSSAIQVHKRACRLAKKLHASQDCEAIERETHHVVNSTYEIRKSLSLAPHVARHLKKSEQAKSRAYLRTTLNRELQIFALKSLRHHVGAYFSHNMNDGAVVVLDNQSGDVLAYVGNIGPRSTAPYVDGAVAVRQAGSTLKPFIYAEGIEKRLITAATVLDDSPLSLPVATGVYRPSNFDHSFRGAVPVRDALASSLNIPAIRVLELVGVQSLVDLLSEMGFTGLQRADFYGPSLALGSVDVKLLELTNAYRTLANGGVWSPCHMSRDDRPSISEKRVFSPEVSYIISDILSDPTARASTFGFSNVLATRFWTAVKTGTSKDMRDNWAIGFSERYTVGVWTGNFSGQPMWNVSGISGAAPVWEEIMSFLHRHTPSERPPVPSGIKQARVRFSHSGEIRELESFVDGTEPYATEIRVLSQPRSRISFPTDKAIVAISPDTPADRQTVFFEIVSPSDRLQLLLNGRRLGSAKPYFQWQPLPGEYSLELRDGNIVLDKVSFTVRGQGHGKSSDL